MSNYESMKKWARICHIADRLMQGERAGNYYKYYLLNNIGQFAFDMYRAMAERIFREPFDFYENV